MPTVDEPAACSPRSRPGGRLDDIATCSHDRRVRCRSRSGRSRDARVVASARADGLAASARVSRASRPRSSARRPSCSPRRTSRSTHLASKRPGSARSSRPVAHRRRGARTGHRRVPDPRTAFVDPVDDARRSHRYRGLLVDRVVVRAPSIADITRDARRSLRSRRRRATAPMPAVATSPQYEDLLTSDAPAGTARPASACRALGARVRATTIPRVSCSRRRRAGRPTSRPSARSSTACADQPLLRPVTLDDLFTTVPAATRRRRPSRAARSRRTNPRPVPRERARPTDREDELPTSQSTVGSDDPARRGRRARPAARAQHRQHTRAGERRARGDPMPLATVADGISTTGSAHAHRPARRHPAELPDNQTGHR